MPRIGRRAIRADGRAAWPIGAVEPVVAFGAQAPELAEPERGEVASVRLDMVGDRCRYDVAALKAEPTQRLNVQLMRAAALPARGAIPAVNVRCVRHWTSGALA
jgi:hypothetical protein